MGKNKKNRIFTAEKFFVMFMFISFLGWAMETICCSIEVGGLCDRGFISMPFCTIYGFTVLGLYALLGTPEKGGLLLKNVSSRPARLSLYFFLGILITVSIELVTGWFFSEICGVILWDYSAYRFNYKGYICLEFAILWGILILFGMRFCFSPIKRVIGNLPERYLFGISAVLAVLLFADWAISYAKIFLI